MNGKRNGWFAAIAWGVTVLGVATTSTPVAAQSLEEQVQRKREDELLKSDVKDVNAACKSNIAVTWDWPSFKGKLQAGSSHVGSNCGQAAGAIQRLCNSGDEDVIASVQRSIKTIQCRGGVDMADAELKGTTLILSTSLDQKRSGVADYTKQYLLKNLK